MPTVPHFAVLFALLAAIRPCAAAAEDGMRTSGVIKAVVSDYLRTQTAGLPGEVSYAVGTVDARVRLPECPSMQAFTPSGARLWGVTQIGVRCLAPATWTVYVPVTIRVTGQYVTTARALGAGHPVAADDLAVLQGDLTQLPADVLREPGSAVGRTLAAPLAGGQPVRRDVLRAATVIQPGQTVKLVSRGTGFSVSAEGRALNPAIEGQIAQVRGPSGQTVSGIARSGGIVEISF